MSPRRLRISNVVRMFLLPVSITLGSFPSEASGHSGATLRPASGRHLKSVSTRSDRGRKKPRRRTRATRSIDGTGNNPRHPNMNSVDSTLRRYLPSDYMDGRDEPSGESRPSPRLISNMIFAQDSGHANTAGATDFVWQWGQFLDHDIDLTGGDPSQSYDIKVPLGDPFFDPGSTGTKLIALNRSVYRHVGGARQQLNQITGWIDASNVYGSDVERMLALRTLDDTGHMKTGVDNLLPNNDRGLDNAGGDSPLLFLAGDVRANEQVALTAMHTLFVREHNRWADLLRAENPRATGDEIFEHARSLVAAEMQHITYSEFLPVLLGRNAMPRYSRYRSRTDARIMNAFSTAAFRLGHSMLNHTLLRLNADGQSISAGDLALRDSFFAPDEIRQYGIEPLLRGLARQVCQEVDTYVVDDVRNFLFGAPGAGGFDLVSLNIQRGRDHGLPSYNDARLALGLAPAQTFEDISSDPAVLVRLQEAYADVDEIDLWVGGLAEDRYRRSMLGESFHKLVRAQFVALRAGDRFWYARSLSRKDLRRVAALRLSDIIRLNTNIGDEIQDNVFLVPQRFHRNARRPQRKHRSGRRRH